MRSTRDRRLRAPDEWHLESPAGNAVFRATGPHFSVNDMDSMSQALRDGAGIGLLAAFSAIDDLRSGARVRVLPEYHTCPQCLRRLSVAPVR